MIWDRDLDFDNDSHLTTINSETNPNRNYRNEKRFNVHCSLYTPRSNSDCISIISNNDTYKNIQIWPWKVSCVAKVHIFIWTPRIFMYPKINRSYHCVPDFVSYSMLKEERFMPLCKWYESKQSVPFSYHLVPLEFSCHM